MKKYHIAFAVFGFLAVALGAFAAHGLKSILNEEFLTIFQTGVSYQFYHTLALGVTLALAQNSDSPWLKRAACFFSVGIVVFSGSLYTLALTQIRVLGAITPIGGLSFLAGWVCLGVAALRSNPPRPA
jgi:uncharacterized membrane protein YgdD (TMEM256/DUF423 family)